MADTVALEGGPFEGAEIERGGDALAITGDGVPDGYAASYRYNRSRGVYVYDGTSRVLARGHVVEGALEWETAGG